VSGDHPRDYIAQQDRAKERVDYGQGDFGLQRRGRECGQEVDEDLSAQEQQGGGARYEERWLQAKPGCDDGFATVNDHKGRDKIAKAATWLRELVGTRALAGPPAVSCPAPGLGAGWDRLWDVLVVIELSHLAESGCEAERTCDIEGRGMET